MARFLSSEWFDDVATVLDSDLSAPDEPTLVLQQEVTGGPDGDVSYALEISGSHVHLQRGRAAKADVTITEDYATAAAIHAGDLTLQDAFMAGRVKVAGNLSALIANQALLAALDPLPVDHRATS